MAEAQAEVKIITVDAVTNLNTLRQTISDAKKELNKMQIGGEDYRKQLAELNKAQNLLTNALNGTTAETEDYVKAMKGEVKTYNTLVKQMADMKKGLRNIDVSTEEGAESFRKMAADINAVNDELKAMDAMKGDFQRNVGNYKSALDGVGGVLTQMPPTLGKAKKELGDLGQTMQLVGKQPILGIIGLLAPIISQIVNGLKDNKSALDGTKKAMDALKPVMDFLSGILETIGSFLGDILTKSASFLSSNGVFQKIIQGVMGVGNAILQFIIAPFKGIVAAIKVFQEEGVKGIGNAAKAFGNEMKSGVAFKENYKAGQTAADALIAGAASRKPEAKKTGKDLAKEAAEAWKKEMEERVKEYAADVKYRTEAEKYLKGLRDATEKDLEDMMASIDAQSQAEMEALIARMEDEAEAERIIQEMSVKNAQDAAQKKKDAIAAYASGVSSMMSTIADALENGDDATEESVKSAKNLRIAAATIDMISGAVTAFSTAQSLGPIAGPIVGAINAAAVVAAGMRNIAKIKATSVAKETTPSTPSVDATVAAPQTPTVTPTTVTTGAATETAINRASQPQKVYVLQSDIEAAGNANKVQVAESTF